MRIVVSLTTIPSRIQTLRPTIESLFNQTVKPDEIVLNLPSVCEKEKRGYHIPAYLWETIKIYQCERDFGPATKLLPTVKRETNPETRIITVDDDVIYPRETIELLTQDPSKTENQSLGVMGTIWKTERHKDLFIHSEGCGAQDCVVDVLGGYRGVCYRRGLIKEDIWSDFENVCELAGRLLLEDDGFMARYFQKHNLRRYVVSGMSKGTFRGNPNLTFNEKTPDGTGIFMKAGENNMGDFSRALKEYYGF